MYMYSTANNYLAYKHDDRVCVIIVFYATMNMVLENTIW